MTSPNLAPLAVVTLMLVMTGPSHAEEAKSQPFPFLAQAATNTNDSYRCLGPAGGVERLEEGVATDEVEAYDYLAQRLWDDLTGVADRDVPFLYPKHVLLRDGRKVATCSKTAIEAIGTFIQSEYSYLVRERLYQSSAATVRQRSEAKRKYAERYRDRVWTKKELTKLFDADGDGLVSFGADGFRFFEKAPPKRVIEQYGVTIDPSTGRYPWVPSHHAFILQYDRGDAKYYVYDSDDPDRKWPADVRETNDGLTVQYRIDDHMGDGPSHQIYNQIKPLNAMLPGIMQIVNELESSPAE